MILLLYNKFFLFSFRTNSNFNKLLCNKTQEKIFHYILQDLSLLLNLKLQLLRLQ